MEASCITPSPSGEVSAEYALHDPQRRLFIPQSQQVLHVGGAELAPIGDDHLVQKVHGVPQAPGGSLGDGPQSLIGGGHALGVTDGPEPLHGCDRRYPPEVEPLATGHYRCRHSVRLGGGQHEDGVGGRALPAS